ncbi:uncharacterized protein LOC142956841 isoform X1 [Anarhichas minor]|uniref:uncharacterized protein LOC142956841 isoform X1 n=1 Tax=Anarhichas minor TaxID=65739 RepID=UPI003F73C9A3
MCSVLGCDSGRRGAQRFKLPQDPERRLEWVQFILEVNGQRLKESSWTDITVCNEHFTDDCFEHVTPVTGVLWVRLKPDAVPSVCVKSEPGEHLESPQSVEPVETTEAASQCDDLNSPTSSENSRHTLRGLNASDAVMFGSDQVQQNTMHIDLNKEKAALLQIKGKHVVNESCLFQLFRRTCPSCGCKLQMEKVTCGLLMILNQQCLQCDYRNQWKSQVDASVPTAEDQHLTEVEEVTPESQQEPLETTDSAHQCDDLNSPTSSEKSDIHTLTGPQASPVSSVVSVPNSPDASDAVMFGSDQVQQNTMHIDLNKEKAALLQIKGKHVVNESCLFQLFRRTCPSCGCKLQMEKVTCGLLMILNQQCLQCDYRHQWKSQVDASVPTAEDQHLTEVEEVTPESQQEVSTGDNPSSSAFSEIVTFSDEESDPSDEGEEGDDGAVSSDGEWNPTEDFLLAEELTKESDEETEDEGEEEDDFDSPGGLKINELCTECGSFFTILKRHTCEHKIKPFSCNICGKRCVTETSLKNHSRIHDETYDHPCKYCYVTFKTRVDKLKHEQTHQDNRDPYKCPDCPETFTTNKKRRIHLANHRTPKEYKCGVCGIEFKDVHHLRRHSVVHTGLKPYQCSVCQRGFNQTSHLKSHMRLHTGERPYKCPYCDKSYNHNVSLKSHVQRCHSSGSGRKRRKGEMEERASDAEDSGNKKGTDCERDCAEEGRDAEEEAQKERTDVRKSRKRNTGRPRGRPKRNAAVSLAPAGPKKGKRSNAKTAKSKARKTGSSDEESEDEQSESDTSFESAEEEEEEEEEEEKETVRKSTARSRGRPKDDSDTDFDPEEEEAKKKRDSSAKSSVKRRGRPAKTRVV